MSKISTAESLLISGNGDSVAFMRFAAEAGDDGAAQPQPGGAVFIHFALRRPFHRTTSFARLLRFSIYHGFILSCALLLEDGANFDRSGTDDPDADRRLRVCDPLGARNLPR